MNTWVIVDLMVKQADQLRNLIQTRAVKRHVHQVHNTLNIKVLLRLSWVRLAGMGMRNTEPSYCDRV